MRKKNHVAPHVNCLDLRNALVPFLLPLEANTDANISANITPHSDYLDLTNAVVPLMMPLASHDADSNANDIT